LPAGAPPDFYARCVAFGRDHGARTIVDARGESLLLAMREKGCIVKINREELESTLEFRPGQGDDWGGLREHLPVEGAIIVTMGKTGAIACDEVGAWSISAPAVEVVSAIGSGDAFAAGLAVGLVRGMDLPAACRLASSCGAASAMTACAGHLDVPAVQALCERILAFPL
jgi:tagatose 6-phosphate kinase